MEPWQREVLDDLFSGYRELLAVLPTGSGKTTMFAGVALYHAQYTPTAKVPIGAASAGQASILYDQAAGFVRRSPALQQRFKVLDGFKMIRGLGGLDGRVIKVYSASDDTGDGIIPTLALIDELHRHKGHSLYGVWRDKLTKRNGQMAVMSTAGDDENNPLEQLREAARQLPLVEQVGPRHVRARSSGREFCMHEWAMRHEDNLDDLKLVKLANPSKKVTLEELRMRHDSPSTKPWEWSRYTCNLRSKGEDSAIAPQDFDARVEPGLTIASDVPVYLGLDLGWKIDHAAIAPVGWESDTRRLIAGVITLAPPVDEFELVAHLLRLREELNVLGVVYDPNAGGRQMVQQLERGTHQLQTSESARSFAGLPSRRSSKGGELAFVEHSQDNAPMALAAVRFDEAFRFDWLRHDGKNRCDTEHCRCGGFRGHVINAVTRTLGGEKWRYDRPSDAKGSKRARYPIDGLTAAEMAHSVAVAELGGDDATVPVSEYRIIAL